MLSSSVDPKKMGVFIGIFNMFIVLPQIFAALGGINFLSNLLGQEDINTMILAGISLIIAGLCNLLITSKKQFINKWDFVSYSRFDPFLVEELIY